MANQPVKKKFDYEKHFSNEIQRLIKYITTELSNDIAFTSLTFDVFLIAGLECADSMLYKALNTFLTVESISNIHDTLFEMVSDANVVPVRPNRTVNYSAEMKNLFMKSVELMQSMKVDTITSDMVFTAFMQTASSRNAVKKLFTNEGINGETALDLSKKVRETMTSISNMSESEFESFADKVMSLSSDFFGGIDLGDGNDSSTTMVVYLQPGENGASTISTRDNTAASKKSSTTIDNCTSLNVLAERGQLDTVIGREKEILEIARVLGRKNNNNVVLIGEPGVGKTSIINGLALRIVKGTSPLFFKDCTIWELNIGALVGNTQFRGQFEARISNLIKSLKQVKNSILFIDNIQNFTTDRNKAEFDLFGSLEPIFSCKDVMVIVSTTKKGYHNSFEAAPDIERKFQKIYVEEPNDSECVEIIDGILPEYEKFHGVTYCKDAVNLCISLAKRYIPERKLPSSALDILDEAGSVKKIKAKEPELLSAKRNKLAALNEKKDKLIKGNQDDEANLRDVNFEIEGLKIAISIDSDKAENNSVEITPEDIYEAVSKHTGIPVSKLSVDEKRSLINIDSTIKKVVVGQDEAVEVVSRGIKRNKIGIIQGTKPILSCMFIGNTGCGKTLFAKTLAKEIFGDEKYLVRFDMSEYADETAVNKLIGAGAGYIGYNEGGLLTEAIKNKKHCVVLIDEIEKANEKVYNLFLQILDEGFITDNTGYKVDFKNTIVIMTSNVGASKAANERTLGFEVDNSSAKRDVIEKELKRKFPPEFLNRIDEIVYFNDLSDDNLKEIVGLELEKLNQNLKRIGYSLEWDDAVVDCIFAKLSADREYGARPISRIIRKEIENKITDMILANEFTEKVFKVVANENSISVE